MNDCKVFANSSINKKFQNSGLTNVFQSLILGFQKVPNYLIGDPTYPLTSFCIKEFDHSQNDDDVICNNMLRPARNPSECTQNCRGAAK